MAGALNVVVIAATIFIAGIVAGVIAVVTIGVRREERDFARTGRVSLTRQAPGRASLAGRLVTGLYVSQRDEVPAAPALEQDLLV